MTLAPKADPKAKPKAGGRGGRGRGRGANKTGGVAQVQEEEQLEQEGSW